MRGLILCVALVVAVPVSAQVAVSDTLGEATRLMADGEFERALGRLDAGLARTRESPDVARLQLARGQCLLALARRDQARDAFTLALKQDVTVELPPNASPDALEVFERARAAFPGTVAVTVDGEASVRIDDRNLGPAPLTTQLPAGVHVVEATAADGRSARQEVRVKAGRALSVALVVADPPKRVEPTVRAAAPVAAEALVPPPPPPLEVRTARASLKPAGWVTAGSGAAVAVAGGVALWQARAQYDRLVDPARPALTPDAEASAVRTGGLLQGLGWAGLGVGAAAIAAGVVLLALPPEASGSPVLGVVVSPDGSAWLGVSGGWP